MKGLGTELWVMWKMEEEDNEQSRECFRSLELSLREMMAAILGAKMRNWLEGYELGSE